MTLTFDLSTLKVVSESRQTWATSVPILVFLGISVLDLGEARCTRQTRRKTDRRQTRIIADHPYKRRTHAVSVYQICSAYSSVREIIVKLGHVTYAATCTYGRICVPRVKTAQVLSAYHI